MTYIFHARPTWEEFMRKSLDIAATALTALLLLGFTAGVVNVLRSARVASGKR